MGAHCPLFRWRARDLQAIDGDDDILTAMACELVKNKGIGESAESIWRNLAQLQPLRARAVEAEPAAEESASIASEARAFYSLVTIDPVPVSAGVKDLLGGIRERR